jgi:hypothetical protein
VECEEINPSEWQSQSEADESPESVCRPRPPACPPDGMETDGHASGSLDGLHSRSPLAAPLIPIWLGLRVLAAPRPEGRTLREYNFMGDSKYRAEASVVEASRVDIRRKQSAKSLRMSPSADGRSMLACCVSYRPGRIYGSGATGSIARSGPS